MELYQLWSLWMGHRGGEERERQMVIIAIEWTVASLARIAPAAEV